MVASVFQIVVGFSGLMGIILRFVGPLVVTPTITLIGLSLFATASSKASEQWWIAIMSVYTCDSSFVFNLQQIEFL
jgi:nucleobase transporter 1/2